MLINFPLNNSTPPEHLKEWCLHQGSLTDKLRLKLGNVELKLLSQAWQKVDWWGKYFLQIQDDLIFQREIFMTHAGVNYWYAKTLIPETCYNKFPEVFSRLQNESVRNLIFDTPEVKRVQLMHYPVDAQCLEYYSLQKKQVFPQQNLWARLAQYALDYSSFFYVMELLLPELGHIK